jgi:hypothetical protein
MTDPRDFDRRMEMDSSPTPWGWITGALFIVVVLALVFTSGTTDRTASNDMSPPATTGLAPRTAPPPATVPPAGSMPPIQTPSTSGQAR